MNWRITPSPPVATTVPDWGWMSPATSRSSVVLPAPFGPTSAAVIPSRQRDFLGGSDEFGLKDLAHGTARAEPGRNDGDGRDRGDCHQHGGDQPPQRWQRQMLAV